jgi:hypothetical protein
MSDKAGRTIEFLLSKRRDMDAAQRFFSRATRQHGAPRVITLDGYAASHRAVAKLKARPPADKAAGPADARVQAIRDGGRGDPGHRVGGENQEKAATAPKRGQMSTRLRCDLPLTEKANISHDMDVANKNAPSESLAAPTGSDQQTATPTFCKGIAVLMDCLAHSVGSGQGSCGTESFTLTKVIRTGSSISRLVPWLVSQFFS